MQNAPMQHTPYLSLDPWQRLAGIVALFTLLGPLLGALGLIVLMSTLAALTALAGGDYGGIGPLLIGAITGGMLVALPPAYGFGLFPAGVVGLVVAIGERRRIGVAWGDALYGAVVLWLIAMILTIEVAPPQGRVFWFAGLLVAHLAGAALCTLIARKLFGAR
mgnify:FL=1|jgi:hypothetical protein